MTEVRVKIFHAEHDAHLSVTIWADYVKYKGGQAFLLRLEFAFEFANLVRAFFGVCTRGGELVLECGDFAAAKERAEALKGLAAWIDDFEDGKEVGDAHGAIIAHWLASLQTYGGRGMASENMQGGAE